MFVIFVCLNYFWLNEYTESITSTFSGAFLQLALIIMPYSVGFASIKIYENDTIFTDDFYYGILICLLFLLAVSCIIIIPASIWDSWNYSFLNTEPLEWRKIFFVLSVVPFIAPILGRRNDDAFMFFGVIPGTIGLVALLSIFIVSLWNSIEHLYYYLFS